MSSSSVAVKSRTGRCTRPKLTEPVHTERAMSARYPSEGARSRERLERWQRLGELEHRPERVTDCGDPVEDVVDRPAVWAKVDVVELVPRDRHRDRRAGGRA